MSDGEPILLTLDVDWAPDWMIEAAARRLKDAGVRATWFATHQSPATSALCDEPLFEVGLHPNFLPNSSHGADPDAVMTNLRGWFPAATAARTHSLMQSEPLLGLMADRYGIAVDCSIHLPQAEGVRPHGLVLNQGGSELVRLPHVFQDNMYMLAGLPWEERPVWLDQPGWKVLNFHPVHLALNSFDMDDYARAKVAGPIAALTLSDLPHADRGRPGAAWFFEAMIRRLTGGPTWTVVQAIQNWRAAR